MARANRHFIPGHIWHLTHRCHKREFLLKFSKDRNRWMELLFKAGQRYHVSVLNFTVTSNHIHLIVEDSTQPTAIPRTMQYVAGRLAQEYNRRKNRKGAFWEDRYHATAIESGEHLWRCMVYVDLNMVRAGVVSHPSEWKWSGFHEIRNPKTRYRLIAHDHLKKLFNIGSQKKLVRTHERWIQRHMKTAPLRQAHFSESIAVGNKAFVETVQQRLKSQVSGRRTLELPVGDNGYQLKEDVLGYADGCYMRTGSQEWLSTNKIPWNEEDLA